jgi:hypothetical protein
MGTETDTKQKDTPHKTWTGQWLTITKGEKNSGTDVHLRDVNEVADFRGF